MGRLTVAIAGTGPAGLALAILLRRQGWAVTVIDRFTEPQPVGSGLMLQPTGLAVLTAMGLDPRTRCIGAPVGRILGKQADTGAVVLDVSYGASPRHGSALGVHRSSLFGLLHEAALAEDVALVGGVEVVGIERGADGRPAVLGEARRLGPFDLVVDALGARSPLGAEFGSAGREALGYGALWATVPWPGEPFLADALEQRYRRASTMVGMLPVGARWGETQPVTTFFWSLRGADHPAWLDAGLAPWKAAAEAAWPQIAPVLDHFRAPEDLTFARYSHHTLARPCAARLAAIGDAAHSTSPQLGQGANMALLDALALANALAPVDAGEGIDAALKRYARARRWHVRLYQWLSRTITPLYQSDGVWAPGLRDHLMRPLALAPFAPPILAAAVSGRLLGPRLPR